MITLEISPDKARIANHLVAWLYDLCEMQAQLKPGSPLAPGIDQAITDTVLTLRRLGKITLE
jgi:hypothetical protein